MDMGADSYKRFLKGDNDAIGEIVEMYRAGLEYFLLSILNNEDLAEEITQDTFCYLFIKKPKFKEKSSFKTWLYQIGKNRAYKYLKKNRRFTSLDESFPEFISEERMALEEKYFSDTEKLNIISVMSSLKKEYREILWLTYFEELSNKECAVILDRKLHDIESLLYRARKALKRILQEEGYTYENK